LELTEFNLPDINPNIISFILNTEAAAAFDEITRNNLDDLMIRQGKNAWPNAFRQARFVPTVEYLQANRIRTLLIEEMARLFKEKEIEVYVAPSAGSNLLLTNLTGHPVVVVPCGFDDSGHPLSISFIGNLFEEGKTLRLAKAYQLATGYHLKHPDLSRLENLPE